MTSLIDEILIPQQSATPGHAAACNCATCQSESDTLMGEVLEEISYQGILDAINYNVKNAKRVGWLDHKGKIVKYLGLDGLYFPAAEWDFAEAVARWQKANGLVEDGKLGPNTWRKLKTKIGLSHTPKSVGTTISARMKYVMNLLVTKYGFPVYGAAGLVGNLYAESGVLPNRVEGSTMAKPMRARDFAGRMTDFTALQIMNRSYSKKRGPRKPGVGLAQWTSPGRRSGLFTHSFKGVVLREKILFDMDAQVDYLVVELKTKYRRVYRKIMHSSVSLNDASDEVLYNFEIPGSILDPATRRKLPRSHPKVQKVFQRRRHFGRNTLRAYRP